MAAVAYYLFVWPLSHLPLWILYRFSDLLYVLLISIFPYRKNVIDSNLSASFPEKSEREIKQMRRKFYRHFSDIVIEGVKNLSISKNELLSRISVVNPELMVRLFAQQKSVLLVSGHYNNWEWMITSQSMLFPHKAMGIGMPMSSKFWDQKVNAQRERFGMKVIHSANYLAEIENHKDQEIAILTLADQSPGNSRKSFWMNFLNQPTAVLFGAEQLANEFDFAVVFFAIRKVKRGNYSVELKLITDEPRSLNWGEITQAHAKLLEQEIRKHPEQWIWSHKRWKREVPSDLDQLKQEQHEKFNRRFRSI
jgi:KDO2-lipid IV(A) lauroyltransferase